MFFSIIVPVYNVEKYLQKCIDSVLEQSFTDFELLLVDDGSKDESGKICENNSLLDTRVKTIHKPNGGAADSRNVGLDAAQGEYVIYLDSDDYISDTAFLEKIHQKAKHKIDIILYNYVKYYEAKNSYYDLFFHYPNIEKEMTRAEILKLLVEKDAFYAAAWMKAIRTEVLKKNEIVFQPGIRSEDQEWYYHVVLCAQSYAVVDEPFVVYRQRPGSVTATFSEQHLLDNVKIIRDWATRMQNENLEIDFQDALLASLAKLYANLLIAFSTLDKTIRKKHEAEMKKLVWLLKYDWNPRTHKMKRINGIVGFSGTVFLLALIQKNRRR